MWSECQRLAKNLYRKLFKQGRLSASRPRCHKKVKRVFQPRAACKAASEAAYLSHHAIVIVIVIISMDGGGGTPPWGTMLNSHTPCLGNWLTWLPLSIIQYGHPHCAQCSTLWQMFEPWLLTHAALTLISALVSGGGSPSMTATTTVWLTKRTPNWASRPKMMLYSKKMFQKMFVFQGNIEEHKQVQRKLQIVWSTLFCKFCRDFVVCWEATMFRSGFLTAQY